MALPLLRINLAISILCAGVNAQALLPVEFTSVPSAATTVESGNTLFVTLTARNNTNLSLHFTPSVEGTELSVVSIGNSCAGYVGPGDTCILPIAITGNILGSRDTTVYIDYEGRYPVSTTLSFTTLVASNWVTPQTTNLPETNINALDGFASGGAYDLLVGTTNGIYYRDGSAGLDWANVSNNSTGPLDEEVIPNRDIKSVYIEDALTYYFGNGDGLFKTTNGGTSWQLATGLKASTTLSFGTSSLTLTAKDAIASSIGNNWKINFDGTGAAGNCLTGNEPIVDDATTQTVTITLCKDGGGTIISTVTGVVSAIGSINSAFVTATGSGTDLVTASSGNSLGQTFLGRRIDGLPQYAASQDGTADKVNVFVARRLDVTGGDCSIILSIALTEASANSSTTVSEPGAGAVSVELSDVASVPNALSQEVANQINFPTGLSFSSLLYAYALSGGTGIVAPFTTQILSGCSTFSSRIATIAGTGSSFIYGYDGRSFGAVKTTDGISFSDAGSATLFAQNISAITRVSATRYYLGLTSAGVSRTTDGGTIWTDISSGGLTNINIRSITAPSASIVYAGTTGGVYKTINADTPAPGDVVWENVSSTVTGLTGTIQALAAIDANIIFAGTSSGLFESTDGGASWVKKGTAALPSNADIRAIKVIDSTHVFAAFNGGVVQR